MPQELPSVVENTADRRGSDKTLFRTGTLHSAIFNVGAERMLDYAAAEVKNNITPGFESWEINALHGERSKG